MIRFIMMYVTVSYRAPNPSFSPFKIPHCSVLIDQSDVNCCVEYMPSSKILPLDRWYSHSTVPSVLVQLMTKT
ncbi:hypothetical protein D3C81_1863200 [compost metagenome]